MVLQLALASWARAGLGTAAVEWQKQCGCELHAAGAPARPGVQVAAPEPGGLFGQRRVIRQAPLQANHHGLQTKVLLHRLQLKVKQEGVCLCGWVQRRGA